MIEWKNLDTLTAYEKLRSLNKRVKLQEVMAGESGELYLPAVTAK
jgi:hypothetical protein